MFSVKQHSGSCLMALLPEVLSDMVRRASLAIPEDAIYHSKEYFSDSGRESTPHITMLYGIEEASPELISPHLRKMQCKIGSIGWFHPEGKDYHVIFFRAESAVNDIEELRNELVEKIPYDPEMQFPVFSPHITIAYINKDADLEKVEEAVAKVSHKDIEGQRFVVSDYWVSMESGASYILTSRPEAVVASRMRSILGSSLLVDMHPDEFIGVDFDGTLAKYEGYKGPTVLGPPVPAMLERVLHWLNRGKKVVIFTARADNQESIAAIKKWCMNHIGEELEVTNVKSPNMVQFWDDRAVSVDENTGRRLDGMW